MLSYVYLDRKCYPNLEALKKKTERKKVISNKISEMKRIFESEKEKCPKKKLKMKTVSDESWVGRGCNNPDMLRKRKVEFDTVDDEKMADHRKRPKDHHNQTWDGWREKTAAVGLDLVDRGLRKNSSRGTIGRKGEREVNSNFNGHSRQPRPIGAVGRINLMDVDTGTPKGIDSEHWEMIG